MIEIHAPKVGMGDCFLIYIQEDGHKQLLVIDSGFSGTYPLFKKELLSLMQAHICETRMLLTHIDQDHIGGFKKLFQDASFQMYDRLTTFYYNPLQSLQKLAPEVTEEMVESADHVFLDAMTSYSDAITLETLLAEKQVFVKTELHSGVQIELGAGIRMTILSPSSSSMTRYQEWVRKKGLKTEARITDYHKSLKELIEVPFVSDNSIVNASSLSFIIESKEYKLLFLGDAIPEDVFKSLCTMGYSQETPLFADVVKISHHGSRHNTSPELLDLIRSKHFLISGNSPDKETLARIVFSQNEPIFWFNYDISHELFTESEMNEFSIRLEHRTEWILE